MVDMGAETDKRCKLCGKEIFSFSSGRDKEMKMWLKCAFPNLENYLANSICKDCSEFMKSIYSTKESFIIKTETQNEDKKHIISLCKRCGTNKPMEELHINKGFLNDIISYIFGNISLNSIAIPTESIVCSECWYLVKILYSFKTFCNSFEMFLEQYQSTVNLPTNIHEEWKKFMQYIQKIDKIGDNRTTFKFLKKKCMFNNSQPVANHGVQEREISSTGKDNISDPDMDTDDVQIVSHEPQSVNVQNIIDLTCDDMFFNTFRSSDSTSNRNEEESIIVEDDEDVYIVDDIESESTELRQEDDNNLLENVYTEEVTHLNTDDNENYVIPSKTSEKKIVQMKERKLNDTRRKDYEAWGCYKCVATNNQKKAMRFHQLSHEEPLNQSGKFACKECPFRTHVKRSFTFHNRFHLTSHMINTCHKTEIYFCMYCCIVRRSRGKIQAHMKQHIISDKEYQCIDCNYTVDQSVLLKHHYEACHNEK
ncbi:uncharacterized protein LOC115881806 isoform X2 [Sitophilus oryzae]|uniref:Uncharacterized protein LOC115881806 isoform X2 n=1 Tax=Sitophilus oryzae TaxID=7048 RepID=A0A6J2XUW7_SITOR|nr:uncharacterized protein LOC115881806 isoform X2 [Sitophilus oryzae]